eukprot:TRINITY_DN22053_c0_g1_i1.p1 TRINITY_DN22053_c0_g1~~TRINITY_DN22053_c0_g1_i1.p1  ORF type:complete len:1047 (+),score=70.61 TRINITY_DN22053_c0_g1_i1:92-3232(+)
MGSCRAGARRRQRSIWRCSRPAGSGAFGIVCYFGSAAACWYGPELQHKYLRGCAAPGCGAYATLLDAQSACCREITCNGVTQLGANYELRTGTTPTASPSSERSWLKKTDPTTAPASSAPSRAPLFPSSSPSWAPTSPTGEPSSKPTQRPTDTPTIPPSIKPTASPTLPPVPPTHTPSAGQPSASPTVGPSLHPTASPSGSPTFSPSLPPSAQPSARPTALPTASPTDSPSTAAPTLEPLTPVSFCTLMVEGADCPDDSWRVTHDFCRNGDCAHYIAAAGVTLFIADDSGQGVNVTSPVEYTVLGLLEGAASSKGCDGLLGVAPPGGGSQLFQEILPHPLNVSSYHLLYAYTAIPARLIVGWRLEGQQVEGGPWVVLGSQSSDSVVSFALLEELEVRETVEPQIVRRVRLIVTAVRGDEPYTCRRVPVAIMASAAAAAGCCCCLAWALVSSGITALCGAGVMAFRSQPRDPDIDAPWMGTEDYVQAKVLECYEELEQRWEGQKGTVVDEAAANLTVPQGSNPVEVLVAHAQSAWHQQCSGCPQLRPLPSVAHELLRRYSHEAQDIDFICGLPGAPKPFADYQGEDPEHPKKAKAAWQGYKEICRQLYGAPSANPALYSVINRCARTAAESGSEDPDAWLALGRVIKQTSLLIAAAAHASDPPPPVPPPRCGQPPQQRWLRMLKLPADVRNHFARLQPGMYMAWSVAVASVTANRRASADFMLGEPGSCVLVRMAAPQSDARALALGPTSLYGGEGELLVSLGTIFRIRRVQKVRLLTRYVQPTCSSPIGWRQLWAAFLDPLLIVDVDWVSTPLQWCDAARRLCNNSLREAEAADFGGAARRSPQRTPLSLIPGDDLFQPLGRSVERQNAPRSGKGRKNREPGARSVNPPSRHCSSGRPEFRSGMPLRSGASTGRAARPRGSRPMSGRNSPGRPPLSHQAAPRSISPVSPTRPIALGPTVLGLGSSPPSPRSAAPRRSGSPGGRLLQPTLSPTPPSPGGRSSPLPPLQWEDIARFLPPGTQRRCAPSARAGPGRLSHSTTPPRRAEL